MMMSSDSEKHGPDVNHSPATESPSGENLSESVGEIVFNANAQSLPLGYFTSAYFLGTMAASGFAIAGVH